MVMGRNDPEPLYNMSRDVRKRTLCICKNKDAKPISVFVFAKWIVQSLFFLNLKFQWSSSLRTVTVQLSFCHNCLETSKFVFSRRRDTMLKPPFYSLYRLLTLKIRPRSPKYKQLLPSYQQCICASFIKICSLVQKIKSGNEISHLKKGCCDLEN